MLQSGRFSSQIRQWVESVTVATHDPLHQPRLFSAVLAEWAVRNQATTRWGSVTTARRASSTAEVNPGNGLVTFN